MQGGSGEALLSGARAHRKSAWSDRGGLRERSRDPGRARGGAAAAGSRGQGTTTHAGSRQTISRAAICGSPATTRYRAPRGGVRTGQSAAQQFTSRRTEQRGFSAESEKAKAGGAEFCLDQTLGGLPAGQVAEPEAGGMAVSDCRHSLQFGAYDSAHGPGKLSPPWRSGLAERSSVLNSTETAAERRLWNEKYRVFQHSV